MGDQSENQALWYKDAVIYELHVRSFYDSTGTGVGDFKGLIQKLDYLSELGVNTIWLMPFFVSPLKDEGYDVEDFLDIHPDYGTLTHFKTFLKEAHKRELRVLIDVAINHTSDQHPWFKKARKSRKGSKYHKYYIWSENTSKYREARILVEEENTNWAWDPTAKSYYWHRFGAHMPALNYRNPEVHKEVYKILNFWLDLGVDGMRLSSVPFIYQKEGTICENLPEVHEWLRALRRHMDEQHPGKVIVADANMWPEDTAAYFGQDDECHMGLNFPIMPRLFMALDTEDVFPIIDILDQTPEIPQNGQWGVFLRNHDNLPLEMVTDEERDYLMRAYADDPDATSSTGIRRRLAPLMENDRKKIKLLNALMFSLPGSPIIYYGDEIGMGDNIYLGDRNGQRTPMQWNAGVNAGFSSANPQKLYLPVIQDPVYRYEAVNVESQRENRASLYNWFKDTISLRKRIKALGWGDLKLFRCSNSKVLVFTRTWQKETVLVVVNLSRYAQFLEVDLEEYKGLVPVEIFSQNKFPKIGKNEYQLTIGPHGYYWFALDKAEKKAKELSEPGQLPGISLQSTWLLLFRTYQDRRKLEKRILPTYMKTCRWFGGKARHIVNISIVRSVPVSFGRKTSFLLILEVRYTDGLPENYFMPVYFVEEEWAESYQQNQPKAVICQIKLAGERGILIDAIYHEPFRNHLFGLIKRQAKIRIEDGQLVFHPGAEFRRSKDDAADVRSHVLNAEQSNTSVIYNERYFFKIYRKLEREINPDLEMVRFLSEEARFKHAPQFAGGIELMGYDKKSTVLGLMQNKIENRGDAWVMTLDYVKEYFTKVMETVDKSAPMPELVDKPMLGWEDTPTEVRKLIGKELYDKVRLLGHRTAEMHKSLSNAGDNEDFEPEAFNYYYQRSIYAAQRKVLREKLVLLRKQFKHLSGKEEQLAQEVLDMEPAILDAMQQVYQTKIRGTKIRIHGDYHLGQILYDGSDFTIIDFEGEPGIPFSERRLKKSALKDVAGMVRSFHYAAYSQVLLDDTLSAKERDWLGSWATTWYHYIANYYFSAWLETAGKSRFVPEPWQPVMRSYLLEKAIYELGYELNSRPDWVSIPLKGIKYIMDRYSKNKQSNG